MMLEWQAILVKIKLISLFANLSCYPLLIFLYLSLSFSLVPSGFGSGTLKESPFKVIEMVVFAIIRSDNASFTKAGIGESGTLWNRTQIIIIPVALF